MADIGRATVILDAIAEGRGPLTLTELAGRTGLPRSTVHRIVQALERELYVVRVADRHGYSLGPGLLKFGMNAHLRLLSGNRPRLARLAREINENVELAVFSGREVVVVDQLASPDRLRGVTKVGKSFSLHASCLGMALLAHLPDERVRDLLSAPLTRFTAKTVTDRARIMERLEQVRRSHIAIDQEEHDLGICAVATGFLGPTGALQAVSVVMPTARFTEKRDHAIEALGRVNPAVVASGTTPWR
ncbi:IclR family transcriptional regulator [Nocardia sp. CDC186]|uniref:IclR family transcriptional regulator n=1 Tax=Nocardia implantans TaxID=3108168 RepID=A0ABU6AXK1_9NOCA|nr:MULTISPECIES: IclR family transcriptional regulator [unclassified Nocardia]MBF6193640.1 IclR family transcriptional regulator [Nocardia beijingensis]MEA3529622.1 IclR family transcriptional regulator [Nocardia sp. CDC192]MEB3512208.1 IclR family transcriptional regulator [Nocardia sp. CDC186]